VQISAVIIVKNAAKTIEATLESLKLFDEVILYDNGSEDNTLKIASGFKNVKTVTGKFIGFGPTKNLAATFARNDWIFSIDADEVASPGLISVLENITLNDDTVYSIERHNYYRKKRVRHSGWGKEIIFRLYNRKYFGFNNKMVHETIDVKGAKKIHIPAEIRHYSFHSISDFLKKMEVYSSLFAESKKGKKKSSVFRAFLSSFTVIINKYFFHLAFLDGYRGVIITFTAAIGNFYKYLKLYEANKNDNIKCSLIINSSGDIRKLQVVLNSVFHQSIFPDEIIIVSNNHDKADDNLIYDIIQRSIIHINHIKINNSLSLSMLQNDILPKVRYEYIIMIDGDSVLHPEFINDHLQCASENKFILGTHVKLSDSYTQQLLNKTDSKFYRVKTRINVFRRIAAISKTACKKTAKNNITENNVSLFKKDLLKLAETVDTTGENAGFAEMLNKTDLKGIRLRLGGIIYRMT